MAKTVEVEIPKSLFEVNPLRSLYVLFGIFDPREPWVRRNIYAEVNMVWDGWAFNENEKLWRGLISIFSNGEADLLIRDAGIEVLHPCLTLCFGKEGLKLIGSSFCMIAVLARLYEEGVYSKETLKHLKRAVEMEEQGFREK